MTGTLVESELQPAERDLLLLPACEYRADSGSWRDEIRHLIGYRLDIVSLSGSPNEHSPIILFCAGDARGRGVNHLASELAGTKVCGDAAIVRFASDADFTEERPSDFYLADFNQCRRRLSTLETDVFGNDLNELLV